MVITIIPDLAIGRYTFQVAVTGTGKINGRHYLFVGGGYQTENGIQVFEIAVDDGALNPVASIVDNDTFFLNEVVNPAVAETGGTYYLFAGGNDNKRDKYLCSKL